MEFDFSKYEFMLSSVTNIQRYIHKKLESAADFNRNELEKYYAAYFLQTMYFMAVKETVLDFKKIGKDLNKLKVGDVIDIHHKTALQAYRWSILEFQVLAEQAMNLAEEVIIQDNFENSEIFFSSKAISMLQRISEQVSKLAKQDSKNAKAEANVQEETENVVPPAEEAATESAPDT